MSMQKEQLVELSASHIRVIETIMSERSCPKGFECYGSKFEKLCPARHLVGTNLVECQSVTGQECPMSIAYGKEKLVCGCQLRNYVAVELET